MFGRWAKWLWASGVLLALGAAACAHSAERGVARPPASDSAALAPAPTGWHVVSYPGTPERATWFGKSADGSVQMALDGWRIELRGDKAELAEQALLTELVSSCRSGSGWLHLTRTRDLYWSDTFLGDMRHVGRTNYLNLLQCGPEVVTLEAPPTLWTKSGPQPLTHREPIVWAAFTSEREGRALAYPDIALVTHDGGKTFARGGSIDMNAAAAVFADEEQVLTADQLKVAVRAWLVRAVTSEAGRAAGGILLTDGTWLRVGGITKLDIIAVRTPDGAVKVVTVADDCDYFPWGAQLLASCGDERGPGGVRSTHAVYPKRAELGVVPRNLTDPVADAEGKYLFGQTRRDGEADESALVRFDGHSWRSFPSVRSVPLLARHGWLVLDEPLRIVAVDEPERVLVQLSRQRVDDGRSYDRDEAFKPSASLKELDLLERSVVLIRRDVEPPELVELELPSGKQLRAQPFPWQPGTLAFADAEHGLAVSVYHAPQLVAPGKAPARLADILAVDDVFGDAVHCTEHTCTVEGDHAYTRLPLRPEPRLILSPSEPRQNRAERPPEVAPAADVSPEPVEEEEADDEAYWLSERAFRVKDYVCELAQPPVSPREVELRGFSFEADDAPAPPVLAMPTYGGQLDIAASSAQSLAWHGRDERGEYRVRTGSSPTLARLFPQLPTSKGGGELRPALVSRRFALLFDTTEVSGSHAIFVVRESGQVDELIRQAPYFTVAPLTDGRALLRIDYDHYQRVFLLANDGSVTSQRSAFLDSTGQEDYYLALRGTEPGFVRLGETSQFYGLAAQAGGAPFSMPKRRLAEPCRGRPPADAVTLFVAGAPYVDIGGYDPRARGWGTHQFGDAMVGNLGEFEASSRGLCLRGVFLDAPVSGRLVSGAAWLHGRAVGRTKSYGVVCRGKKPERR